MPRPYHSPSSVELGRRCPRAWAYRYIAGIRKPEPVWSDALKGRDRSLALGKAVHATLEAHYTPGAAPDWFWFPGQVAASGLDYLPDASTAGVRVETSIGDFPNSSAVGSFEVSPDRGCGLEIAGVRWFGLRDLVDVDTARVLDYKTTRSIAQYAKGPAELLQDLQANLYAYSAALEFGRDEIDCRWVYFETGKVRRAAPVDFVIRKAEALSVIEAASEVARELDKYDTVDQAPMNVHACGDYGGCEFHEKAGGPCNARVAIGALIQARVKKEPNMALSEETKARLAARAAGGAAAPPPAAAVTTPEAAADRIAEANAANAPPPADDAPPPPPPVVLKMAGTPKRKASAVGASGSLAELAAALTASEAAVNEATASLEAAKEAMRKALA